MDFNQYILREKYKKMNGLGDRLGPMKQQINWERFRNLVARVFHDNETGGRPHTDEVLVIKAMLLQSWYGLSDQELEFQANDRLSFQNFLDFPDSVPDFSTIWKIRERLQKAGVDKLIWGELQRQLDAMGYEIKKGVIQDASFIEADFGKKRHRKEKAETQNGKSVACTEKQLRHIDGDGSFAVKNGQVHYGYKLHAKTDVDYSLIRSFEVTTASVHDSQVNLTEKGDEAAFRDKGYFGVPVAEGVDDMTMKRATRAGKLNGGERKRNCFIARIRAPGERPFSVVKRVFNGARTFVKRLARVSAKEMFKCFAFNLYQLVTLKRKMLA